MLQSVNPGQTHKPLFKQLYSNLEQSYSSRFKCQICHKSVDQTVISVRGGRSSVVSIGISDSKRGQLKRGVVCNSSFSINYSEDVVKRRKTLALGILLMLPIAVAWFTLNFTGILEILKQSCLLRQQVALLFSLVIVRYVLAGVLKGVRTFFEVRVPWERSTECYLMQQVSPPLQILLVCASIFSLAQNTLPQIIPSVTVEIVHGFTKRVMSFITIGMTAYVALNMKSRYVSQRNEQGSTSKTANALDKMITIAIITASSIILLQNLGFDLQSLLTLGGVGGIALGLAGQEILQNLLHGVLIIGSSAFTVGDEVVFWYNNGWKVEGIVMDIGWYRSSIRSFDREVFSIPNSVFSKTVVLNVTRKMGEWRIRHDFGLRLEDIRKASKVVSDIRRILKQEKRVIQKLPIRVFLTGINRDQVTIFMNFFVTAANREDYVLIRQDMLLAIMLCVKRNGTHLARNCYMIEMSDKFPSVAMNSSTQHLLEDKLNFDSQQSAQQIIVDPHLLPSFDSCDDEDLSGRIYRVDKHTIRSGIRDRKNNARF